MRNSTILFIFSSLSTLLLIFPACGIKKPPEPPEKLFPLEVKGYQVRVRDGCAELTWKYPGVEPPEKYRITRREQAGVGAESKEQVFETSGKNTLLQDCTVQTGLIYGFQASGVSRSGLSGEPSKIAWIYLPRIPAAPENFQAGPGDKFVDLTWNPGPEPAYNLYRSEDKNRFPDQPIHLGPIKESKYTDAGLENGKEYYYCLRAVILQKDYPQIESRCSQVSATPVDLIAPSRPRGLVVMLAAQGVLLKWFKSPEPDLLGYLVFRRRPGEKIWKQITPEPIPGLEYLDAPAKKLGGNFEYAISALDNAPSRNQSLLSGSERISVP